MPLPGIGVAPAAGGLYSELAATTRRAFVPRLFVQIYFGSPTLFYMMGNAQKAAGGLNQITVPMQAASMVQGQFTGYGGGFPSPQIIPAIQNGQWNLAYWVVPVPLPFGETIIQATDREISLLKARMNDVAAVTKQNFANLLFTNNTAIAAFSHAVFGAFLTAGTFVAGVCAWWMVRSGRCRGASKRSDLKENVLSARTWRSSSTKNSSSLASLGGRKRTHLRSSA